MDKIGIIGIGYVGLVTAVGFAELGYEVTGVDKDGERISLLRNGISPIFEPGVDELLKKNLSNGNLIFSDKLGDVVDKTDIIFICVGTPSLEDGRADLTQVEEVSRYIAQNLNSYKLIVEKSTVPVKTAQWIKRTIKLYNRKDVDFDVASNPEFLKEGNALNDFFHPDRIVIGVESERARKRLRKLYERFDVPFIETDINTAEIIKHASNAFLAMKISFINMIADLCEKTGADIEKVSMGVGLDKRIGTEFLNAGIGYGGSCFPKDVKAFYRIGEEHGLNFGLLKEVDRINEERVERFLERLKDVLWLFREKKIGILGASFKPETDDIREAPSLKIIDGLLKEGAVVKVHDPKAISNLKKHFGEKSCLEYCEDPYEVARDAEALLLLTEWKEYKSLNLKGLKQLMKTPIFLDGRNLFSPEEMKEAGFEYHSIGRKS